MLVVLAAVLFMFVYQPPGAGNNDETVTLAGREPDRLGLNLNPTIWGRYFIGSERALPFRDKVAYVSLFAVFVGFIYARRRRLIEDPGAVFSLIVLLTYGLLLMLFIKHTAARYWFAMLPLFVVVASAGLVAFVRAYGPRAGRRIVVATKGSGRVYGALAVGLLVAAIAGYVTLGAPKWDQIVKASGPPCWGQGWRCDKSIEEHHAALRPSIGPQDTIIASNPWITNYYLGLVPKWGSTVKNEPGDAPNDLSRQEDDQREGWPARDSAPGCDAPMQRQSEFLHWLRPPRPAYS